MYLCGSYASPGIARHDETIRTLGTNMCVKPIQQLRDDFCNPITNAPLQYPRQNRTAVVFMCDYRRFQCG